MSQMIYRIAVWFFRVEALMEMVAMVLGPVNQFRWCCWSLGICFLKKLQSFLKTGSFWKHASSFPYFLHWEPHSREPHQDVASFSLRLRSMPARSKTGPKRWALEVSRRGYEAESGRSKRTGSKSSKAVKLCSWRFG